MLCEGVVEIGMLSWLSLLSWLLLGSDYFAIIPNNHLISQSTFKVYSLQRIVIFQINLDENNPTQINTTHLESKRYLYNIYNDNIIIQKGKITIK